MRDIQAFHVVDFTLKKESTFNVLDSEWFLDLLDTNLLDAEGKGLLIIEKIKIIKLINKFKKEPNEEDRQMYLQILNQLLEECGENTFVLYLCK
jgi:hypothetical protein